MTGHIYRDAILEQHVRLFRGAMGAEFLFMDDNARPHRANIVHECLQSEDITRMDWPAYSPDLNPIEHVWDMLGRRIVARQPPPTCLPELRRALFDEWCNTPQDQIDNLILSMPRRLFTIVFVSVLHLCYQYFHRLYVTFSNCSTICGGLFWQKNKIVLDSALRLQSFRTPKTQQLVSEVGLNANNKSGMEAQFQTLLEKLTEMKSDLTSMNANMGEMKSELTASMNANMDELNNKLTANKEEL
ncbi:transposable element Tcb2 transposase [Trichonephila clavipes]|nr:transposable element Tcb2 transposase [Trichonephila clavipes]